MGINLVTFYNSTVTPQDDALIYENALPGSGMIYGGNVTIKNANTLHVTAGHGALCGRKFTIEETDVPVQLTSSGTLNGRLYIHMDLSNVDEPITLEVERASTLTPPVQQSNVNITDGIYEIDLATFQISTSTISNLDYVAPFIHYEFLKEIIIAPVEKTNVASQDYVVGRHLVLNNILYRVTAAITAGQTIAVGTNVEVSDDVEKQIETINGYKLNQTVIATRQANLTASKAYVVGEQFIYNNTLYEVTAAISKNAAITIGGNCKAADNITSQISNLENWQDVPYYTSYGTILSTTKIKKNKNLCVGYVNISTYSGGRVGTSFSVNGAYSQTIPMVARNSGTGVTTFVDAYVSGSGVDATLPSGYDEIRGSFVIPLI
ncbi:MAG: hypothetical protein J6S67_08780 [Methanobrevibacter sp.]|nr:hypothetical protein [Methanobrevibacter sp.]